MTEPRPYRGLTKEGKWVKGWYVKAGKHSYIIVSATFLYKLKGHVVLQGYFQVISSTLGQFTGLKDKKRTEEFPEGQEVYGGDKLQDANGDIGTVYWKENIAGFYCKWGDGSDLPLDVGVAISNCEVIGSAHDHLLKGAE